MPVKDRIIYLFLITSLYGSMFLPILQGLSRKLGPNYLLGINLLLQGYIYLLPLVFIFFTKLKTKQFALISLFFIYIALSQPFTDYSSLSSFFNGYRTYLAVLFYIPIVYHLIRNDETFDVKIERHIKKLFLITLGIFLFEVFSRYVHNDLYHWFLSLALHQNLAMPYSRPIGVGLDIHMQGIILAFAVFYFFIHKNYTLSYLFFFILFLSGIKTWLIAVITVSVIYFLIYITKLDKKVLLNHFVLLFLIFISSFILFYPQIVHYQVQLSSSSYVVTYMINLWVNSFNFLISSIIPVGFLSDTDRLSPIMHKINIFSDISILYFGSMIGTFGLLLYMIISYYHILKKSKYTPIVLLSLFSLVHTYYLNHVGIFIIFTYFTLYYIIENRKKCAEMPNINVFKDTSV
jgi:hypothetical protein